MIFDSLSTDLVSKLFLNFIHKKLSKITLRNMKFQQFQNYWDELLAGKKDKKTLSSFNICNKFVQYFFVSWSSLTQPLLQPTLRPPPSALLASNPSPSNPNPLEIRRPKFYNSFTSSKIFNISKTVQKSSLLYY